MAPSALDGSPESQHREPLKLSGALSDYEHFDVTPVIGREYPTSNLVEWLNAPNSDEIIRDLAITSQWKTGLLGPGSMLTMLQSLNVA
jgi:hypothetical protein